MKNYYVSANYFGMDVGFMVQAENVNQAPLAFAEKFCGIFYNVSFSDIKIEEVEEIEVKDDK